MRAEGICMHKTLCFGTTLMFAFAAAAVAQVKDYKPVTEEMLKNPSPDDWLMYSRTYDAQRYSPLKQIDKQNVGQLGLAWKHALPAGSMEGIPLVHNGVMYVIAPAGVVDAFNAATGDPIWEYKHQMPQGQSASTARSKTIAIYQDLIIYCAPDSTIVGIDAATGKLRWSVPDPRGHTSGAIVVEGKVITGGTCTGGLRANCYIAAHDALTGKELWKFYTAQGTHDVNPDTWGGAPEEKRTTSTWGLPGTYDPVRNLVFWGIANPTPNTRLERHAGNIDAISRTSPSDLYSNSTVALDPNTGKLAWYYQHLPGLTCDADEEQPDTDDPAVPDVKTDPLAPPVDASTFEQANEGPAPMPDLTEHADPDADPDAEYVLDASAEIDF